MALQAVSTEQAPAAIGPYSQAIVTGDLLFTSGQLPLDPRTGQLLAGSIEEQAHMVFKNLAAIALAAGTTLKKTIKTTVFLADIKDFKAVNSIYAEYFSQPYPARSAFQVAALPLGANLEVEAIIHL
jgi:2-iminobutanoate/2-iminopropanoate deaminase